MERDWADIERHMAQAIPAQEAASISASTQQLAHEPFIMETNIKNSARCEPTTP